MNQGIIKSDQPLVALAINNLFIDISTPEATLENILCALAFK